MVELIDRVELRSSAPTAGGASTWSRTGGSASRAARPTSARPSLALILAHADLESITPRARPRPREGAARAPLRRAHLRRPVVLAAEAGVRRVRRLRARSSSPARCGCTSSPGSCQVTGRRSEHSLYDYGLATYDAADVFRHEDSAGFVRLWGLGIETWAAKQGPGSR